MFAKPYPRRPPRSESVQTCERSDLLPKSLPHNLLSGPHPLNLYATILYKNRAGGRGLLCVSDHPCAPVSLVSATLMHHPATVANKRLTPKANSFICNIYTKQGEYPSNQRSISGRGSTLNPFLTSLPLLLPYFLLRSWRDRISGQRAKMEVVRPPRGVNSPRTTHHSGRTASTMSRRILLMAFS